MRPRLIHPVEITIAQINTAAVVNDPTFNEPRGAVPTLSKTAQGQVSEARGQSLRPGPGGTQGSSNAAGHVVFERDALEDAGITLCIGDRITHEGGRALSPPWRITRTELRARYLGRAWHLYAFYTPEE